MNLSLALYLTDLFSNISCAINLFVCLGITGLAIAFVGKTICIDKYIDKEGVGNKYWTSIIKKWPWIIFLAFLSCIFPNKKTMYLMLGSVYLQESNLPKKVSQALELKLDEYIKELSNKEKKD